MPIRIPLQGVIVKRDGVQVRVPVGKAFDFTEDEVAEIDALEGVARKPKNELADLEEMQEDKAPDTPVVEKTSKGAKGAKGKSAISDDTL